MNIIVDLSMNQHFLQASDAWTQQDVTLQVDKLLAD